MECYGKQYKKLEKCGDCEYSEWCKSAGDPKQLTYNEISNAYPDNAISENCETYRAEIVKKFLSTLFSVIPDRDCIYIICARMAGFSYADIGDSLKVSRQAIHKKILQIESKNFKLGEVLKKLYERKTLYFGDRIIADEQAKLNKIIRSEKWKNR